MTDEERFARMEELVRTAPNSCEGCRYARDIEYSTLSRCENPVSRLAARSASITRQHRGAMNLNAMRGNDGLCGPNALLYRPRTWHHLVPWMQATTNRAMAVATAWAVVAVFGLPVAIVNLAL